MATRIPITSTPMPLSDAQRKYLRRLGHDLNPVVLIGQNGLSDNLVNELQRALDDHELVKVKARVGDRELRDEIMDALASRTAAEIVQRIGHMALYYRRNPKLAGIVLPD